VTIDPAANGGARAEVAVKGVNPGGGVVAPGGTLGLGGPRGGGMDIGVRYALGRGTGVLYTTAEYTPEASYPTAGFGENHFILQMSPTFDWLSVDRDRNMIMTAGEDLAKGVVVHAKEQRILSSGIYAGSVEHKYSYNAAMGKLTAWGWSSTRDHVGVYFINPSNEYIGGGPEKVDLVGHMGATLLDYRTSGHYAGGSGNSISAGESWKRVVGPIFGYMNALDRPDEAGAADLARFRVAWGSGEPTPPRHPTLAVASAGPAR
jgi:rhamnogalacturonan endolyase